MKSKFRHQVLVVIFACAAFDIVDVKILVLIDSNIVLPFNIVEAVLGRSNESDRSKHQEFGRRSRKKGK